MAPRIPGEFRHPPVPPNFTASASADWVASSRWYVGARAGYFASNRTTDNVVEEPLFVFGRTNRDLLDVPEPLQQDVGFRTDISNEVSNVDRLSRVNAQIDATLFGRLAGPHTLKGGLQLDRRSNDVNKGSSANVVFLTWDAPVPASQRGPYGSYRVFSNPVAPKRGEITLGSVSDTTIGLFVQDAWTVSDGPTIDLGLRTENETVPFYTSVGPSGSVPPIHFSMLDKLAPRAGAAWDVAGDGRWKVHGSWGVFYDTFKLAMPQLAFGGTQSKNCFFQARHIRLAAPPRQPGLSSGVSGRASTAACAVRRVVREHRSRPGSHAHGGTDRWRRAPADRAAGGLGTLRPQTDRQGGGRHRVCRYGRQSRLRHRQPRLRARHRSVRRRRVSQGRSRLRRRRAVARRRLERNWALTASYVWSRLHGNYSGLSQSHQNGRTDPNVGITFDDALGLFDDDGQIIDGPLATDRPHQAKTQLVYTAPFGSTWVSFDGGERIAGDAFVQETQALAPVFYAGRASDGRTQALSQTDVSVHDVHPLGGRTRLTVGLNVLNVFNQAAGIRASAARPLRARPSTSIRPITTRAAPMSLRRWPPQTGRDPRFLQYEFFQAPIQGETVSSVQLLRLVGHQDDVASVGAAGERQPSAIGRPREAEDLSHAEVRDLHGWPAGERLPPDIGHAVPGHDVVEAALVRCPDRSASRRSRRRVTSSANSRV